MGNRIGCPRRSTPAIIVVSDSEDSSNDSVLASPASSVRSPVDNQAPLNTDIVQPVFAEFPGDNLAVRRNPVDQAIDWENTEYRIYVVWRIPLADNPLQFRGLHWGLGIRAYAGILRLNQGTFGGIRWRRCNSLELAERLFREELPLPDREIGTEYYERVRM